MYSNSIVNHGSIIQVYIFTVDKMVNGKKLANNAFVLTSEIYPRLLRSSSNFSSIHEDQTEQFFQELQLWILFLNTWKLFLLLNISNILSLWTSLILNFECTFYHMYISFKTVVVVLIFDQIHSLTNVFSWGANDILT